MPLSALLGLTLFLTTAGCDAMPPRPFQVLSSVVVDSSAGERILGSMRARYDGKWYRTLTFVQTTRFPNGQVQTWYEAYEAPGRLRIDVAPVDSGNGTLFRNDSAYSMQRGAVARSGPQIHPLLLLGFDVYFHPIAKTAHDLAELGFDLSKVHESIWQGRRAFVIGATAGDTTSSQFWIDAERLVFVRLLQTLPNGVRAETQFNKYQPLGGGWIAPEVLFFRDGKPGLVEEYADMKVGMTFEPSLFVPAPCTPPKWVGNR